MRAFVGEVGKMGAFLRRDVLTALTYKVGFASDWVGLIFSAVIFLYFVGRLVDPSKLPQYGGGRTSYMEFVLVGLTLTLFVTLATTRVSAVLRQEQLEGTLEPLLMTPTSPVTIQVGSVLYDFIYIPIRITLFYVAIVVAFGVHIDVGGIAPTAAYLGATIPFVWGLGLMSAAITMTFRQGGGLIAFVVAFLTLSSGAYFPLDVLPGVLQGVAQANPLAIAVSGMRESLLANAGWSRLPGDMALLLPMALISLALGGLLFRVGVRREREQGTLGLY
ncbi:MAG: ABC transporter permease [Gaiellaceae bacterium]